MKKVFQNIDLKNYIFEFIKEKGIITCYYCNNFYKLNNQIIIFKYKDRKNICFECLLKKN